VNGWYGDQDPRTTDYNINTSAIETIDNKPVNVVDGVPTNAIVDEYGVPMLKYPYSQLSAQESLTATNPLNRFLVDASVGKLIYLKDRQSISINLTVNNILNNTHFKTGGYQQARLPRQTRQGVSDNENSVISPNIWKFPAKYYYAWGTNFYLNIQYKF
jgi:hypothetical protein